MFNIILFIMINYKILKLCSRNKTPKILKSEFNIFDGKNGWRILLINFP